MPQKSPSVGLLRNLSFNLGYVIPNLLQGTFRRRRFWVGVMGALQRDPAAVRFVARLRQRYPGQRRFYVRFLTRRVLLILDAVDAERILALSPEIYGPPKVKRDGMHIFQPDAVTVSTGNEWVERRQFNETVLNTKEACHELAVKFHAVVRDEIATMRGRAILNLGWDHVAPAFERIMLRVVFGDSAADDHALAGQLSKLMNKANRLIGMKRPPLADEFFRALGKRLRTPDPDSLAALCLKTQPEPEPWVESQLVHWMFAIKDTLAENFVRALALVAVHPESVQAILDEFGSGDTVAVYKTEYLEGCVNEGMRLWPTTPVIMREALYGDVLGDQIIAAGAQVALLNTFNHRDLQAYPDADRFVPERWYGRETLPLFYHLSGGSQFCAGRRLALFIAKAAIAEIVSSARVELEHPQLDLERLPHAFNHFRAQFILRDRS